MNVAVNASLEALGEASVAALVAALLTFAPSGTFVCLGERIVDTPGPTDVAGEMGKIDCEKQREEGE